MGARRIGGIAFLKKDGKQLLMKGEFSYGLGTPEREAKVGVDGIHGYTETPTVPFVEGEITDHADLDLKQELGNFTDGTITLELANGKVILLNEAFMTKGVEGETGEGKVPVRFEGTSAEEI